MWWRLGRNSVWGLTGASTVPGVRRLLILPLAVLVLAGCGGSDEPKAAPTLSPTSTPAEVFTAHGYLDLISGARMVPGSETECSGDVVSGYGDIRSGTSVVILDGAGRKVAIGELGVGVAVPRLTACRFGFDVSGVPAGRGVYSVKVAERGSLDFAESDAGSLRLTLGHL